MREISSIDFETLKLKRSTNTTAPSLQFYNDAGRIASIHANADGDILYFTNKSNTPIPINFGCDTAADLASLLGVTFNASTFSGDCNTLISAANAGSLRKIRFDIAEPSATNKPSVYASTYCSILSYLNTQICTDYWGAGTEGTYIRRIKASDGTWSPWTRLDNFGCNTAADLASLLGVDYKGVLSSAISINTFWSNLPIGLSTYKYGLNYSYDSFSPESGIIIDTYSFKKYDNNIGHVIGFGRDGSIWQRSLTNGTWSVWQRIDNYGTTSLAELASALGVAGLEFSIAKYAGGDNSHVRTISQDGNQGFLIVAQGSGGVNKPGLYAFNREGGMSTIFEPSPSPQISSNGNTITVTYESGNSSRTNLVFIKTQN